VRARRAGALRVGDDREHAALGGDPQRVARRILERVGRHEAQPVAERYLSRTDGDAEERRDDDALRPALVQRGGKLAPRAIEALVRQDELVGVAEDP
jgi:hypothetical protein